MHRLSQTYISTEKWERQMTCESDLDQIYPLILSNESCARAGEGVTFPKSPPPHMTHHRREHRPSVSRSPTCGSRVKDERLRCLN